ncbi:hypothetical protein BRD08_07700 [Halobacteriales archaeon SW_10_66_29]|nr:MAG: hypothetical protein BRD08_07700 [Halobacteriales archaeon SW_10_66_29]
MSDDGQSGAGRREVAYRLFATEFEDADLSYSESDEERAPNYVVTPTGARVNRLFAVGVLTEVEQVSDDVLRGRVVDPTGAFVLYAGQYQPDEMAFLEAADTPTFVAVTGKARTFQPEDSDRVFTSIRPETINEVDAETRDRWTVQAAEHTLDRIAAMAGAIAREERGDDLRAVLQDSGVGEGLAAGIPVAVDHYGTTPTYLAALRDTALDAARVVAGTTDEVDSLDVNPDAQGDARLAALTDVGVEVGRVSDAAGAEGSTTEAPSQPSSAGAASQPTSAEAGHSGTETSSSTGGVEPETVESSASASSVDTSESTDSSSVETAETGASATDEVAAGSGESGASSGADDDVASAASDESESGEAGAGDETAGGDESADGELGDFDPGEYELEDETREQIEEEYGTEFQSGTEVEEPGSADIETEPDDAGSSTADQPATSEEPEPEPAEQDTTERSAETVAEEPEDLQAAVVDLMDELDDGSGIDRDALIETATERFGVDEDDVEDAIQGALMDGQCYEPDDETLKPI